MMCQLCPTPLPRRLCEHDRGGRSGLDSRQSSDSVRLRSALTAAGQRRTLTGFAFKPCHPGRQAPRSYRYAYSVVWEEYSIGKPKAQIVLIVRVSVIFLRWGTGRGESCAAQGDRKGSPLRRFADFPLRDFDIARNLVYTVCDNVRFRSDVATLLLLYQESCDSIWRRPHAARPLPGKAG